jgi:hypothetical protein
MEQPKAGVEGIHEQRVLLALHDPKFVAKGLDRESLLSPKFIEKALIPLGRWLDRMRLQYPRLDARGPEGSSEGFLRLIPAHHFP